MRWTLLPLIAVPLMAGCNLVPDYNASALTSLRPAAFCDARLPFFGHYTVLQGWGATPEFIPANGSIFMRNDGGWCTIRHEFVFNDRVLTYPMSVMQPPVHGEIVLGAVGGELWLAYRPASGFSGSDFFQVRLHSPVPEEIPVHVAVQP